jgi:arylsulfatase A-like enzyme
MPAYDPGMDASPTALNVQRPRAPRSSRRGVARAVLLGSLAVVAAAIVAGCGDDPSPVKATGPAKPTARPSIVLIDVSGLQRADVYPASGAPAAPNARKFLDGATSFSQAAATSGLTLPSLASVLTGWTPHDAGIEGPTDVHLVEPIETLAETLAREGYATAAFVRSGDVTAATGFNQGFAAAKDLSTGLDLAWSEEGTVHIAAKHAAAWLAARPADRPFFLFVVLDTAGVALNVAPEGSNPLDNIVRHQDGALGPILAALESPSLPADLVTILFSDHGDAREAAPATGSAGLLSDERIRVPLGIRGKGWQKADVRGSCSLADVLPTVRDLMGLPAARGLSGRSLVPLAAAPDGPGRPVLSQGWREKTDAMSRACLHAVRTASAKFIAVYTTTPSASWTEDVFDLAADPQERASLPRTAVDRFDEPFRETVGALRRWLGGKADDETHDQIKIGYTGGNGPCGGH